MSKNARFERLVTKIHMVPPTCPSLDAIKRVFKILHKDGSVDENLFKSMCLLIEHLRVMNFTQRKNANTMMEIARILAINADNKELSDDLKWALWNDFSVAIEPKFRLNDSTDFCDFENPRDDVSDQDLMDFLRQIGQDCPDLSNDDAFEVHMAESLRDD